MNKSFTLNAIGLVFFAIATQALQCHTPENSPSYYQMIITWFYGNPECPQSNSGQAPDGVTAQDYITQFRHDLNGSAHHNRAPVIPWNEVDEMEAVIREELRFINLRDTDTVNAIIRSVLLNHVKTNTILDLKHLEQSDLYVTSEDYHCIPNSHEYNMLSRLKRAPHLNGESIAEYFGESRNHLTRIALVKRHQNNPFYQSRDTYH